MKTNSTKSIASEANTLGRPIPISTSASDSASAVMPLQKTAPIQTAANDVSILGTADAPQRETEIREKIKNLYYDPRNKCWYLSMKTPKKYQSVSKSEKIRRSLGTDNREEAIAKLPKARDEAIQELEDALKGVDRKTSVSVPIVTMHHLKEAHIPLITSNYISRALQEDYEKREKLSDEGFEEYKKQSREDLQKVKNSIARLKTDDFERVTRDILHEEKIVAVNNNVFHMLVAETLKAKLSILNTIVLRNDGELAPEPSDKPFPARNLPVFRDAYSAWSKNQNNEKTKATYLQFVYRFEQEMGPLPVAAMDGNTVDVFAEKLARTGLSLETIENYCGAFNTMVRALKHTYNRDGLSKNVQSVLLRDWLDDDDTPIHKALLAGLINFSSKLPRRVFKTEEAQAVLNHTGCALTQTNATPQDISFAWFVRLGFFSGARLEELAQLRISDIENIDGTYCLHITNVEKRKPSGKQRNHEDTADMPSENDGTDGQIAPKQVKTKSSVRRVPVHISLVNAGFIDFVDAQKQKNCQLVFSAIVGQTMFDRLGAAISKRFSRTLEKLNLKDGQLCFHSCRYNVIQAMVRGKVDPKVRNTLVGHSDKKRTDCYYSVEHGEFSFEALRDGLSEAVFNYSIEP